ncbi:MAG: hypothetical protein SWY16_24800 [Cyanobacteriota bacterium]|nr:hypothetical protein [Cyanobacteriota bacterium]
MIIRSADAGVDRRALLRILRWGASGGNLPFAISLHRVDRPILGGSGKM